MPGWYSSSKFHYVSCSHGRREMKSQTDAMLNRGRVFGFLLLCTTAIASQSEVASADERPNIVLIMCDDMGFSDIGCYGGEIDTPNLDRLAAEGMRFRTFYNNAKCEHTRASLLTGHWWPHVGASATVHYSESTFGERLRETGYRTLMTGKWHAGQTPFERGFDRYYGLTDGCCNFWNPGHARPGEPEPAKKRVRRWANDDEKFLPFTPENKDFYTTDVFTDYALEYLDEYGSEAKPFLLYLAYTAPHYPLHASEEDVAKYRGSYGKVGWEQLRVRRFATQQRLGVLPNNAELSPLDVDNDRWDDLDDKQKDWWDLRMATYAAMVDRLDRNIGRVLAKLEELQVADNTVIFFLSDNGACPDSKDRSTVAGAMPWEVTSYLTQGKPWANASNTPYRRYKTTDFEGGTRTPMIAWGPGLVPAGTITDHVGHLVDFVPTFMDLAGAAIPSELPGHSLLPALREESVERPWPIYWQFGASQAIRDHQWKAIRHGKQSPWELYDLARDPTECMDLAKEYPERLSGLQQAWLGWWQSYKEEAK